MLLKYLYLRNFRNYATAEVSFGPQVNLIHGSNAQGKTNLLEAVHLLSTGRSFRTPHLKELILHGAASFYVEGFFTRDGIEQTIKLSFDGNVKSVQYNNTSYANFSNVLGLLPSVLYIPADVSLICGAPAERRRFLDLHLAQADPLYVHHFLRYHRAMKQRNHLLRMKQDPALSSWEHIMAASAEYLVTKRREAILELQPALSTWMQRLSLQHETLDIEYQPSFFADSFANGFCLHLEKMRKKEMLWGHTAAGPHRDEVVFNLNQKPAKTFSSEGQKRCCLAAIRLAEWQRLQQLVQAPPLLGIDDFAIHLDAQRQELLQTILPSLGQTFLTSPHLLGAFPSTLHSVEKGCIIKQDMYNSRI
jgi:DNA replication and repair protein RecF